MICLQVIEQHAGELQLLLTDLTGKRYLEQKTEVNAGINQMKFQYPTWATGKYILRVKGADLKKSLRVVLLK